MHSTATRSRSTNGVFHWVNSNKLSDKCDKKKFSIFTGEIVFFRLFNDISLDFFLLFLFQVNHILYSNRSAAYIKLEQFEKALADALKAKELDPSWPKVSVSVIDFYVYGLCGGWPYMRALALFCKAKDTID